MKIIVELEKLIKKLNGLNMHDYQAAIDFLNEQKKMLAVAPLMIQGPCLNCGVQIKYKGFSQGHRRGGDTWLIEKVKKWKNPAIIKPPNIINGIIDNTVRLYTCDSCFKNLSRRVKKDTDQQEAHRAMTINHIHSHVKRQHDYLVEKYQSAHIENLYEILINEVIEYGDYDTEYYHSREREDFLRNLLSDLNSIYFRICREYKVFLEKYKCKLCGKVSDTTWAYLPVDCMWWHMSFHINLDDLICICDSCSANARKEIRQGIKFGYNLEG